MNTNKVIKEIDGKLGRAVQKFNLILNQPREMGTGHKMYAAEIMLMEVIGDNPEFNLTQVAELLGITKAAVSQKLKKLVAKGLIEKYKQPDNAKNVLMRLTEKGQSAYEGHKEFHERVDKPLNDYLGNMSLVQLMFLSNFIDKLEHYADSMIEDE